MALQPGEAIAPLTGWALHLQPEPQWEPPVGQRFTGVLLRMVAFLADLSLLGAIYGFVLMSPALGLASGTMPVGFLLVGPPVYFAAAWGRFGTTVAMCLLRIRIVRSTDGTEIGYRAAVVRLMVLTAELVALLTFVPGLLFMFPVLRDRRRQSIHDRAAGTVVVRRVR